MPGSVIIVAGGSGKRMDSVIPKQFLELNGMPVLMWTIDRFYRYDQDLQIILVLPLDQVSYWERLCIQYRFEIKHEIAYGGETRFHSVKSGLKLVKPGLITAIHDGVRPLVTYDTIQRCFSEAGDKGNAVPVIDINDSIREVYEGGSKVIDRGNLKIVQTPQVFRYEQLAKGYEQEYSQDFKDDATVVEKSGFAINLVPGNNENIKLTTPFDMKIASMWLEQ